MQFAIASLLVLAAAAFRLVPHAPNLAPVAALALFGAATLPRGWGFVLPFGAMLLSDVIIGFDNLPVTLSVYGSFLAIAAIGLLVRRAGVRPASILFGSLTGSVLFFLVTNAAVWAWGNLYPFTREGLLTSYAMGVPFFRNTLLGDLFYNAVFFCLYAAATWLVRHRHHFRHKQMLRHPYA